MKTKDFERILRELRFQLIRNSNHKIWSNGKETIPIPHKKTLNKMIARRLLKTLGYRLSVPVVNYFP
jgi:hypothetical protein